LSLPGDATIDVRIRLWWFNLLYAPAHQ